MRQQVLIWVLLNTLCSVTLSSAACPSPSTTYTVTGSDSIVGCTISDVQVAVNMGSCVGCSLVIQSNSFTNLNTPLVPIAVSSVSPGGSIVVQNNVFNSFTNILQVPDTTSFNAFSLMFTKNVIQFTLFESGGYYVVQMFNVPMSGTCLIEFSSNAISYTGSQTIFAGAVGVQFYMNSLSPTVTVILSDNKMDLSGLILSGYIVDSNTAYSGVSVPYIHAIIGNIINNGPALNYPTFVVQRNIIRWYSTGTRPSVRPNLLRLNFQAASFNDITVTDNLIDIDCVNAQIADVNAFVLQLDPHVVGGTLTLKNNRVRLANFRGLVHQLAMNIMYISPGGTVVINNAALISNNSLLLSDISSACVTTRQPQWHSSIVGNVLGDAVFTVQGTLLLDNNTNQVQRVVVWRRSLTFTDVPFAAHRIMSTSKFSAPAGSQVSISGNTVDVTDEKYGGLTADNGVTFTSTVPLADAHHSIIGSGMLNLSSLVTISNNSMNLTTSNFRTLQQGVVVALPSGSGTCTAGTSLVISYNTLHSNTSNISKTSHVAIIYTNVSWNAHDSEIQLTSNTLVVVDTTLAESLVAILLLVDWTSVASTSSLSIIYSSISHTVSKAVRTTTSLISIASSAAFSFNGVLMLKLSTVNVVVTSAGDSMPYVDSLLISYGSSANSSVHAIHFGESSTFGVAGTLHVLGTTVSVMSHLPRPAMTVSLVDTSQSTTVIIAGTVAVSSSAVSVNVPVLCRLWGELSTGAQRFRGSVTIASTGLLLLSDTTVSLTATDNVSVPGPSGFAATCANKGTTRALLLSISSLDVALGGRVTCNSNQLHARLEGRVFLRGASQVVYVLLATGTPAILIANNTVSTTTDSELSKLDTTSLAAAFSITPITLCGVGGLISLQLKSGLVGNESFPLVIIYSNHIFSVATEESWGSCSAVSLVFTGPTVTSTLVVVSTNKVRIHTNSTNSLSSHLEMISFKGSVAAPIVSPTVDFVKVIDNDLSLSMESAPDASSFALLIPSALAPTVISVSGATTIPLRWWACDNVVNLQRTDGGLNVTRVIRTVQDVIHLCKFNPAESIPSHCHTNTNTETSTPTETSVNTKSEPLTSTSTPSSTIMKSNSQSIPPTSSLSASITSTYPRTLTNITTYSNTIPHTNSGQITPSLTAGTLTASPPHSITSRITSTLSFPSTATPDMTTTVNPPPSSSMSNSKRSATASVTPSSAATSTAMSTNTTPNTPSHPPTHTPSAYNNTIVPAAELLAEIPLFQTISLKENTIREGMYVMRALDTHAELLWQQLRLHQRIYVPITSHVPTLAPTAISANSEGFFLKTPNITIRMINDTHIVIESDPLPQYKIQEKEQLRLFTTLGALGLLTSDTSALQRPQLLGTVVTETTESGMSPPVIVTTTVVVGGASLGLASELQSLGALALLGCSDPMTLRNFGSYRVLSPIAVFDSYAGVIIGNAILALGVCLVQLVLLIGLRVFYGVKRTIDLMSTGRLPSLTIAATLAFHTGTAFSSARLISEPAQYEMWEVGIGAVGVIVSIALPITMSLHPYLRIGRAYQTYDVAAWLLSRSYPSWCTYILPHGAIFSVETRQAYGSYISSFRAPPTQVLWTSLSTWTPLLFLVVGLVHPETVVGCRILLTCLGVVCIVIAVIIGYFQPMRSNAAACLDVSSRVCLACAMFCMAAAISPSGTSNTTASTLVLVFGVLLIVLVILQCIVVAVSFLFDLKVAADAVPLTTVWVHIPSQDKKVTQQFSTKDDGLIDIASHRDKKDEGDIEMPPHVLHSTTTSSAGSSDSFTPIEVEEISGDLQSQSSDTNESVLERSDTVSAERFHSPTDIRDICEAAQKRSSDTSSDSLTEHLHSSTASHPLTSSSLGSVESL